MIPLLKIILKDDFFQYLLVAKIENTIIWAAIIYFFGMLINYIADVMFYYLDSFMSFKYAQGKENVQYIRSKIIQSSEYGFKYMMQRRSLVRIFRANTLNMLMLIITYLIDSTLISSIFKTKVDVILPVMTLIFLIIFTGYYKTQKGYLCFIKSMAGYFN